MEERNPEFRIQNRRDFTRAFLKATDAKASKKLPIAYRLFPT
jgi:hypothetical protein